MTTPSGSNSVSSVRAAALVLLVMVMALAGCGNDTVATNGSNATTTTPKLSGSIVVSAAASLTGSFTTIKEQFVAAHPGTNVTINFGSSGTLSTQIQEGAPVDVAAFADTAPMKTLEDGSLLAGPSKVFARNKLTIVTKAGNPASIHGLADLATAGVISLCVETAPCGKFGAQILAHAGVTIPATSITRGADVKATLGAVTEGDAVAGIVYVTDAASVGERVATVDIDEADNVVANYPIAVVGASANRPLAEAFEAYVLAAGGQSALRKSGFLAP